MIGLVDCNNFYASCERLFKPQLKKKPIIVLSNNDGCVIARSNEAKALGIKMGEPAFKIKKLITKNKVSVFSTNFALYGDLSHRVMETLKTEFNRFEIYSIDEAFLDFSALTSIDRAIFVRNKIRQWTGIPVSIGIAPTKTLAKIANHIAKNHTKKGVFILNNEINIKRALTTFPVEDLWGIGKRSAYKLKKLGINTALEFKNAQTTWVKKNLSINGTHIQRELKGEQYYKLKTHQSKKKSISTTRSFTKETKNYNLIKEAISNFANNCAIKLRNEKSCCSKLTVFLMTNFYKPNIKQYHPKTTLFFTTATNDSLEISSMAIKALNIIYKANCTYKKAGVIVHQITPEKEVQISLFNKIDREKRRSLMQSVDKINILMGRDKVRLASQGYEKKWELKQEQLSPCYTTQVKDILTIQI
tara:strand:- start:272 stop:1522 length:1251 start_codon:yes stop_codon:yes gene_type:complete